MRVRESIKKILCATVSMTYLISIIIMMVMGVKMSGPMCLLFISIGYAVIGFVWVKL